MSSVAWPRRQVRPRNMVGPPRSRPPARSRRRWRWVFRCLFGLLACCAAAWLYLAVVGFPEFLQRPILRQARAHGVELDVGRLRLDWYRGLVAESVILAGTGSPRGTELAFTEIAVRPRITSFWRSNLRMASLDLHGGRLAVPLEVPAPHADQFTADSITAELRWLPDDRLEIHHLTARAFGVRIEAAGTLTNASRLGSRPVPMPARAKPPALDVWQANLRRVQRVVDTFRFSREPELHLELAGDAGDLAMLTARIRFQAADAVTPWGDLTELRGQGQLNAPTGTNDIGASQVTFDFAGFHTPWSRIQRGRLDLGWAQALTNPIPARVDWRLDLEQIQSPWGTSPGLQLTIHAQPGADPAAPLVGDLVLTSDSLLGGFARAETNRLTARVSIDPETFLPNRADWQLHAVHVTFDRGSARELRLAGQFAHQRDRPAADTRDWGWWSWIEPFALDWRGAIEELVLDDIVCDRVELVGDWRAPSFDLKELRADLLGSRLAFRCQLNADSRRLEAATRFDLSAPMLEWLLPAPASAWAQHLNWPHPPAAELSLEVTWPGWTLDRIDWREDLLPTLHMEASVEGRQIAYRDLTADELHARLSLTNGIWTVPDFTLRRPEGTLELSYSEDLRSRDYQLKLRSGVDPHAFEPLLGLQHDLIVDLFLFRAPPLVQGELWGSWLDPDRLGARATIEVADFSIRDEDIDAFSATVNVTRHALHATNVQVRLGDEWVDAPNVGFDFASQWLRFTNVTARLQPQRVGRAIGPTTARNLAPYVFLQPPRARVEGGLKVTDTRHADLRFDVTGGPFQYWRFQVPEVNGNVHWLNQTLVITNLHSSFYRGTLDGTLHADIPRNQDSRIRFHAMVNRADFHQLIGDLFVPTNRLEGILNLNLTITDAIANDAQTWQGFGRADLRDGFLWDIPLFGLVSPVLDSVVPGLGRSRINGATATFHVTNSIVHTGDLELRAPLFRLAYRGAVDLSGRVNARVEARLLRDAWVVGPLVSLIFSPLTKLFEYKVTGTIARPELELLYIPKPLQLPLDPVGTIRDMLEDDRPPPPPP
jgi:hypothetical protein